MDSKKLILGSILVSLLTCTSFNQARAQEAAGAGVDDRADTTAQARQYDRDDGFDWGLLGLLGLLGLIPRKRSEVVVHRDDANRHNTSGPNRT